MDGVDLAKRWLESTTWVELPFDAYNNGPVCSLRRLDGKVKRYDLFGYIHTEPPTLVKAADEDAACSLSISAWRCSTVNRQSRFCAKPVGCSSPIPP